MILKDHTFGDMIARYVKDEHTEQVGLMLLPQTTVSQVRPKKFKIDPLVQLKFVGDAYPGAFAHGHSMRGSGTIDGLKFEEFREIGRDDGTTVVAGWRSSNSCRIEHHLLHYEGYHALESYTVIRNDSEVPVTLEMLSSFSITGLTPFAEDDAPETLFFHRLLSSWSAEGRLVSSAIEDLNLEPAWAPFGTRCLRFGQVGSMPVRGYFPVAFMEDTGSGVTWGVQIAHPASWQIEVGRTDQALSMSGGLADREFGHWTKTLEPGETFQTPSAYLTTVAGGVDRAAARLTGIQARSLLHGPAVEEDLPIIFNEYCTTWGSPTAENLHQIAEQLKDKGIRYLVIDSGWYKKEGTNWYNSMGDWDISPIAFPEGFKPTVEHIRKCGMIPGIWFEIEVCGAESTAFHWVDHLLKRDGLPITTGGRRFWDFRDPFVFAYLKEKVIGLIKHYGFGYLKIDYNDSLGIGCDGAESLGEGLRQQMQAVQDFFRLIKQEVPDLVIENCASGGHRLEPTMVGLTSMSSFSDAHECEEIPIIAANMHRVILPRQSQIWAVLRKNDSLQRLVYSLASTMLGRMCLSGDIHELNPEQWNKVDEAISFYKLVSPIIKEGTTNRFGPRVPSYRHPRGWQGITRTSVDGSQLLAVIHTFGGDNPEWIRLPLPGAGHYQIKQVFSDGNADVNVEGSELICRLSQPFSAVCLLLTEKSDAE
ncbi:alpha-galactosidase [Paenibacillus sp. 3LSP]|uniref:glycoside hydrolase family 36 protein n=1 Tax=Paenibacillus sp. 3LSP TaxID=2800795 RepID=UPI0028FD5AAA|nr:alpha-galactosidase [Paenibacillus sp. 3LSP]MDU0329628.1 alpha-galactosidase [Paenibacillus sp. 3LSP]